MKKNVGKANNPDSLADLMAQWQMYEVTRSNSDVVLFAQDMCQDLALSSHLDRAIRSNPGFLRDSSGLWMRFHAMLKEGEMKLSDLNNCSTNMHVARAKSKKDLVQNPDNSSHIERLHL